ncbi:MAG: hypothetical protein WCR46_01180 [Deltaproteobacteria bacterium]
MTPGIKSLTHKAALPAIHYDWFCEIYHCKMLRSACERRQELAKYTGVSQYRAQYSDTCGNCSQIKKGVKMFTEEIETITVNENETTRVCRICKEVLPMEDFYKSIDCIGGRERTCKKCQAVRKRITAESKKSEAKISTVKIKAEPPKLPVGLPPGVTIISTPDITDDDMSIDIDFTKYPDLLVSVEDAANREFRTPAMQILFMLSKYSNDR